MRLIDVNNLKKLKIVEISDANLVYRLNDFGFIKEAEIEILSRTKGMYLIRVSNSVYAINDCLARIINVEEFM